MKIPKYWGRGAAQSVDARGQPASFSCWHGSEQSEADARQKAERRAGEILQKWLAGAELNRYLYGSRPLREEIVQAVTHRGKGELALVTRNGYGALVLNAANAMFLDVDFGPEDLAGWFSGLWDKLRGVKKTGPEEKGLAEVQRWAERHPDLGVRVYRTRAGLRCLITNQPFDPTRRETEALMQELGCDPLYVKLCREQECFRARLTPKPWRLRLDRPPARYPFASREHEQKYRRWEQDYQQVSARFAVCRTVAHLGSSRVHPEIEPILSLHDRFCCTGENLALA